jgi:exosortase
MVLTQKTSSRIPSPGVLVGWGFLIAIVWWSYSVEMLGLLYQWSRDTDYVHGYLVAPFAAYLLWNRRALMPSQPQGSLWGLAILAVGGVLRWLSTYFLFYDNLDPFSMWAFLAGVAVFVGGWPALRWSWPSILFLIFMIPLPGPVASMLGTPLQKTGTVVSTYLLQTCGIPAIDHGMVISLSTTQLEVVQACSGLKMLMLFVAVCIGAAFLMERPLWERWMVVVSSPPIAILANVARITVTGILCEIVGSDGAVFSTWFGQLEIDFHTWAGYFMMPLAVLIIWGEMVLLSKVFVSGESEERIWAA